MRRRWDRYRFGLRSQARFVFVQVPGWVILPGGLASVRYSTRIVLVLGDVL